MDSQLRAHLTDDCVENGDVSPLGPHETMLDLEDQIDALIAKIRDEICVSHPEQLLFQIAELYWMSGIKLQDDAMIFEPSGEHFYPVEYIQSLLAVSQPHEPEDIPDNELQKIGYQVLKDVEDLSTLTDRYVFVWALHIADNLGEELSRFALEAQRMYMVRGHRYQSLQKPYLESLLLPHDAEIRKEFGISAAELVEGLMKIEHALSQGKLECMDDYAKSLDSVSNGFNSPPDELPEEDRVRLTKSFENAFTVAKYNVRSITGWPTELVHALSIPYGEGEYYEKGRYQFWPIVAQPIWERPFITIDGETYCFDYWSVMDNFYRSFQRALERRDSSYAAKWTVLQQEASENTVANIFSQMLPSSRVYINNYYGSKRRRDENDILIQYCDVLFIIEVKAGAFTYAPPLTDFDSHIKRYKGLIESADSQCLRMKRYIDSCEDEVELYDGNSAASPLKAVIDLSDLADIFTISITIDNINSFAARAEKLSFLNMEDGGISIALDDLLTYQSYFDSPLKFLHFLKQRREASRDKRMMLYDELDHLGMYIEHNCYSMEADCDPEFDMLFFDGYREELDSYFYLLSNGVNDADKPVQPLPKLFEDILGILELSDSQNKVQFSSYLLDFSSEAKDEYSQRIIETIKRQKITGNHSVMIYAGRGECLRLTTFVEHPALAHQYGLDEMVDYCSAVMLAYEEDSRWLIALYFDENDSLVKVVSRHIVASDIEQSDKTRLLKMGRELSAGRVARYIEEHGKIGRNQLCPCGSGKKYKKCHGV